MIVQRRKQYACMVEVCCILDVHKHCRDVTTVSCKAVTMPRRSYEEAELALTGRSAGPAARSWSWP
jgi:hypothetical protein